MSALPNYLQQMWPTERQMTRYKLVVPLRIVKGDRAAEGECLDISEGGLGARTKAKLTPGEEIVLEVQFPEQHQALAFKAFVRHWEDGRCGFEFVTITPEQRELIRGYGQAASLKTFPRLSH
jgi:c-di-GMP-binding flagellar brake protein YcgR